MIAHIVCGSPNLWLPMDLTGYIVGVDRGALSLIEERLCIDIAIGDFDSVSDLESKLIEKKSRVMHNLPVEKDVTDCEAALQHVIGKGYSQIYLYGTTGGRFDHQFSTIGMALKYAKKGIKIHIIDEKNDISILEAGIHKIKMDNKKKYISFFALESTVNNLTLKGVKYSLDSYDLSVDDSLCVSNEAIHEYVSVSFDSGYLLVVKSID